jgi:hypothetical protein
MREPIWKLEMVLAEVSNLLHACVMANPSQREEAREDVKFYNRVKEEVQAELNRRAA